LTPVQAIPLVALYASTVNTSVQPTALDYITTGGTILAALYLINKIGELKVILLIMFLAGVGVTAFYIGGFASQYPMIDEVLRSIPTAIRGMASRYLGIGG
jgi:hypothetical protein